MAGQPRRVRVGTLETLAASHLPGVLATLAQRRPELAVQVDTMPRTALLAGLAEGELDAVLLLDLGPVLGGLGFTPPPGRSPLSAARLAFVDLDTVPLALVAAPGHPARALGVLTAARVAAQRLLVTEPGCSFFLALHHLVAAPTDLVPLRSLATMRAWAAEGLGLALLPEFTVAEDLAAGRLVRLPLHESPPELCLRLVWPADRENTDPDLKQVLYALTA